MLQPGQTAVSAPPPAGGQAPPPSQVIRTLDPAEIKLLMKQGEQFIAAGDLVTAASSSNGPRKPATPPPRWPWRLPMIPACWRSSAWWGWAAPTWRRRACGIKGPRALARPKPRGGCAFLLVEFGGRAVANS